MTPEKIVRKIVIISAFWNCVIERQLRASTAASSGLARGLDELDVLLEQLVDELVDVDTPCLGTR